MQSSAVAYCVHCAGEKPASAIFNAHAYSTKLSAVLSSSQLDRSRWVNERRRKISRLVWLGLADRSVWAVFLLAPQWNGGPDKQRGGLVLFYGALVVLSVISAFKAKTGLKKA